MKKYVKVHTSIVSAFQRFMVNCAAVPETKDASTQGASKMIRANDSKRTYTCVRYT
jgi:hypothetical protein